MTPKTPAKKALALALGLLLTSAALAAAAVVQQGNLRITVLSQVMPYKLPRNAPAPIAVFVGGHVGMANGELPPQLKTMTVRVNRHGLLQSDGLPICDISQIQAATTERSLQACGHSLIGSGQFWASIILPGQSPYRTQGRLLVFNGREKGHPNLLVHIFTSNPFNTSFVIIFRISHISHGTYGTMLTASFPQALGSWGFVNRIKLTLRRKYTYRGRQLSYFNASCPAPEGFSRTNFPLALVSFGFEGIKPMSLAVNKNCAVKE